MKDLLLKLYELNEHYHDTKEKMAWLVSSLYFAFSFAILTLLVSNKICKWKILNSLFLIIFLSLIFISALLFINFQFKKKRISIRITEELEDIMIKQVSFNEQHLKQFFKFKSNVHKNFKKYKKEYSQYLSTEIIIYPLIGLFFAAQTIIIMVQIF